MLKKQPLEILVGFRAEADLVKQLNQAAEKHDRPMSWVIRKLLLQALAQNEKTA